MVLYDNYSDIRNKIWYNSQNEYNPVRNFRYRIVINLLRKFKKIENSEILDIGCGNGQLSIALAKKGATIIGIDNSDIAIKSAEELKTASGLNNVSFKQLTGEQIELLNKKFDCIILSEVLEHIEKDDLMVSKTYNCLKSNGIVAVTVPIEKKYWSKSDDIDGHYRRYNVRDLLNMFNNKGFEVRKTVWFYWLYFQILKIYLKIIKKELHSNNFLKQKNKFSILFRVGFPILYFFDTLFAMFHLGYHISVIFTKKSKEPCASAQGIKSQSPTA